MRAAYLVAFGLRSPPDQPPVVEGQPVPVESQEGTIEKTAEQETQTTQE